MMSPQARPPAPDPPGTSAAPRPAWPRVRRRSLQLWIRLRRLGPVGVLGGIAVTLPPLGGFLLLGSMLWVGPWLEGLGWAGWLIYVAGFMLLAGLALLPTYAQALLGGYAFGLVWGSLGALAGFAGAAMLGYVIARTLSGDRLIKMLNENAKWKGVYEELLRSSRLKALLLVTLVRVPPNSPFALTNVVFAAGAVHWLIFAVGTIVGMAPRTIAAVFIAHMFREEVREDLMSNPLGQWWLFAGLVLTVIVVLVIGRMANRALERVTARVKNNHTASTASP